MRRSRPVDVVTPLARTKPEDYATQSLKRAIRLAVPFWEALTATSFGSLSILTRFEFLVLVIGSAQNLGIRRAVFVMVSLRLKSFLLATLASSINIHNTSLQRSGNLE